MNNSNLEFSVLGLKLKFKSDGDDAFPQGISPEDVVSLVQRELEEVRKRTPNLDDSKLAVLAALKIATDKIALEKEYRSNVEFLETKAEELLTIIP